MDRVAAGLQQRDCCNSLDPRPFIALGASAFEPCSACGRKPTQYRERRMAASVGRCDLCELEATARSGVGVQLCDACYRREIRRCIETGGGAPA